ncbi:PAS domain-containing sensor histidine kinase [Ramlibacter sp. AW1]|uniref:histidine kinase n=1 Tax=Ramlibacter aurantiacus TaxID=2801330 RepID=A0A937D6N7_9BURK|nr:PAS domain-containing sensor histidine kinase [Ramlibacter aurantiacus]MBL0420051.1 PAS domain-containing sensor histidine kinase [Ramlibacter aurantiacus]
MTGDASALARALEALDEAPCGLMQTDGSGLILHANATLCRWLGRSGDELKGKLKLQDLLTMGGRIFHQTHWTPLLQMQGSVSEVKLEVRHRDGHTIPMVLNATRRELDGAVVHHVAMYVARDRDAYERELVQSRRRLEVVLAESRRLQEEAKDRALFAEQMIGIVSHDLRNPLSTIQTGAQLLARLDATPQQLAIVQRILRAGDRSNRLIADLLDFTRARLGSGLVVTPRPVQLHALIAEAVDELSLAFPGRALRHLQGGEGCVSADPDRLVQLLGNLVGNAMAYGRPDAPVTVRTEVEAHRFALSVHNLGEPIPEDLKPNLFLPMSRGDAELGLKSSVGLGLFIVREIAKAHQGRVEVSSSAQEGTTFTVLLPRHPEEVAPASVPAAP